MLDVPKHTRLRSETRAIIIEPRKSRPTTSPDDTHTDLLLKAVPAANDDDVVAQAA